METLAPPARQNYVLRGRTSNSTRIRNFGSALGYVPRRRELFAADFRTVPTSSPKARSAFSRLAERNFLRAVFFRTAPAGFPPPRTRAAFHFSHPPYARRRHRREHRRVQCGLRCPAQAASVSSSQSTCRRLAECSRRRLEPCESRPIRLFRFSR